MSFRITKKVFLESLGCRRKGWFSLRLSDAPLQPIEEQEEFQFSNFWRSEGVRVQNFARELFPSGIEITGNSYVSSLNKTKFYTASQRQEEKETEEERRFPVLFEAAFQNGNCGARSDILIPLSKESGGGWKMVEVKSAFSSSRDKYLSDVAYTWMVAQGAGLPMKKASLFFINQDYRWGQDTHLLFREEDVTSKTEQKAQEFEKLRSEIEFDLGSENGPKATFCSQCKSCPYFLLCVGKGVENPITSIPLLPFSTASKIWGAGIKDIQELQDLSTLTPNQQLVAKSIQTNKLLILDSFPPLLETLEFPLFFLDFEAFHQALPPFPSLSPHCFVVSQVSIHMIERPGGPLEHFEMIVEPGSDGRLDVAKMLLQVLKTSGSVLVWHASFEKARIKDLAELFPNLKPALNEIFPRIADLYQFVRNKVHHPAMKGSYSLKSVTKALLPHLSHSSLKIKDGEAAMAAYAAASQGQVSEKDWIFLRKALLEYCERDTFVMVEILRRLVGECGRGPAIGKVQNEEPTQKEKI